MGYNRPTNHFQNENCLVTNMSMTECIRPALYQAYHHVTNIKLNDSVPSTEFNVVGPVCESSDFLNKLGISWQARPKTSRESRSQKRVSN